MKSKSGLSLAIAGQPVQDHLWSNWTCGGWDSTNQTDRKECANKSQSANFLPNNSPNSLLLLADTSPNIWPDFPPIFSIQISLWMERTKNIEVQIIIIRNHIFVIAERKGDMWRHLEKMPLLMCGNILSTFLR